MASVQVVLIYVCIHTYDTAAVLPILRIYHTRGIIFCRAQHAIRRGTSKKLRSPCPWHGSSSVEHRLVASFVTVASSRHVCSIATPGDIGYSYMCLDYVVG